MGSSTCTVTLLLTKTYSCYRRVGGSSLVLRQRATQVRILGTQKMDEQERSPGLHLGTLTGCTRPRATGREYIADKGERAFYNKKKPTWALTASAVCVLPVTIGIERNLKLSTHKQCFSSCSCFFCRCLKILCSVSLLVTLSYA